MEKAVSECQRVEMFFQKQLSVTCTVSQVLCQQAVCQYLDVIRAVYTKVRLLTGTYYLRKDRMKFRNGATTDQCLLYWI